VLLVVVAVQIFSVGLLAEFLAHSRGRADVSGMIDKDPPD
jgi:hypothetical protein